MREEIESNLKFFALSFEKMNSKHKIPLDISFEAAIPISHEVGLLDRFENADEVFKVYTIFSKRRIGRSQKEIADNN